MSSINPAPAPSTFADEAAKLRQFSGTPQEFWPAYLKLCGEMGGAARAVLIRKDSTDGRWKQLSEWSLPEASAAGLALFRNALLSMADECGAAGVSKRVLAADAKPGPTFPAGVAVRLVLASAQDVCLVALFLPNVSVAELDSVAMRLQLVADIPKSYQELGQTRQSRADAEKLAIVLDTLAEVNAQTRYTAAALALCNSLASRLQCQRVSLGWFENGFIKLQAISRTERFDPKMEAVVAIEKTMEEALDQDDEILWPSPEHYALVNRDHSAFAKENGSSAVCSIPLRQAGKVAGVLTLERAEGEFALTELQQLRLVADQVVNRLADLKRRDRWMGARLAEDVREKLAGFMGPEHTWMKATGIAIALVLVILFLVRPNYRVEANYILRSEEVRYVAAPFNGYLEDVLVRPGDTVKAGQVILRLNRDDLLLEEASAAAEMSRYHRESEKARAGGQLAEMRVALSQYEEAKARLSLVKYRLARSEIKAPFDAVVVEGDLRNRLGAPVELGEAMFRLARTDKLYVEAEVNERDVHEILNKETGEIAFVSQPHKRFPIKVERLEPAATPKDGKNVFLVRCQFEGAPEEWWRPGMSGVCKLNVGNRSLMWIITHRTVDFLRMWFWW
ncbi:MAG TPA: HlyD family efflux transporter periplasmic adaptor subunit [Verrucomicrobiae bacterium]